jgi:2-dehydropantoate 2-reductase
MRFAIIAAGAVGGYFGGRMAAAGHDVVFVARPHMSRGRCPEHANV